MTTYKTLLAMAVVALLLFVTVYPAATQVVQSGSSTVNLATAQRTNPAFVGPIQGVTDTELLSNTGFESGSLSPWTTSGVWSVVTNGPHTGTYCAYDIGNNNITQSIAPTPAAQITSATLWMQQPEAQISAIDWMYQGGTYSEDLIWLSASWAQYNLLTFIDPGTIVIGIRIWGYSGGPPNPDETFLDDVSIQTAGGAPALNVTITPVGSVVVPNTGGNINFNISVIRTVGPMAPYTVWARVKNPNGTYNAPNIGPITINTPVGVLITRARTLTVPAVWVSGLYYQIFYGNTTFAYPVIDADSFSFTKSVVASNGPLVMESTCYGELFPGEVAVSAPASYAVASAFPNPFNPSTTISFTLPEMSRVTLNVYDVSGRQVAQLVNGMRDAGQHQVAFDGSNLASGLYLYTLNAGGQMASGKMMLLK